MTAAPRVLYHHRIRADDGQAVHVREMIAALRGRGCAVDECALVPKVEVASGSGAPARPAAGSFWQRLSLPRAAVEALEILYNGRGRAMLRAAAARSQPDFVYERHALHCRAGLDVARELGVPLLLEVNSPMTVEMARLGQLRFPRRARATERAALAGADAVLAVTRVLADMLVDLGARRERVHVIGNGAEPARYGADAAVAAAAVRTRWALPAGAFALGFVGYMRPWHRLDLVLDAMARPELAALALVLMGEGPALAPLRAAAAARGLGERVRVLGVVPPGLDLRPDPVEVADWFEAPLNVLLDPASWTTNEVFWRGANRRYLELDWQGFRIWGVTAAIIANLARRIAVERLKDAA